MADKTNKSIAALVGNTPLFALDAFAPGLYAKLEYQNPAGSVKDRVALAMIRDAETRGLLQPGGTIIEPTSGNTGIGLAAYGCAGGYRVMLTMPDTMSVERRALLAAYGGELVLTKGALGMQGAIDKAKQLQQEIPGSFIAGQFENPANPAIHYQTTGPEIWEATRGKIDCFIAGVGTGGTISGVGKFLKQSNPSVEIVAVEPAESPVLSGGKAGAHGLQGIGAGFVPKNLDLSILDQVMQVQTQEAHAAMRAVAEKQGLLIGVSAGAAFCAALRYIQREENQGKTVVALFADSGERYLSLGIFD